MDNFKACETLGRLEIYVDFIDAGQGRRLFPERFGKRFQRRRVSVNFNVNPC
jgi:hypothetical protein